MNEKSLQQLRQKALDARQNSYSPYSRFRVGAALLCSTGEVYTAANVENASFGLTVCAERIAVFKALSEGKRDFAAIAVAGSGEAPIVPCGACLQVLAEFANDMKIIAVHDNSPDLCYSLKGLLPAAFRLDSGAAG